MSVIKKSLIRQSVIKGSGRNFNKADKLRKDYEKKLDKLQLLCPHLKTKIMDYYWAPGHWGGCVKICIECNKILEGPMWDSKSVTSTNATNISYDYMLSIDKKDDKH